VRITKYVHACLLVESPERVGIIDPGQYSWESNLFDVDRLERLDDIVITHEHPDHLYLPFVKALLAKFPAAAVTTNESVAAILGHEGVAAAVTGNEAIELFPADHETMEPLGAPPPNVGVHYLGTVTHPGDCHHFAVTKEVLALPVTAPWGTVPRAVKLGLDLKPRYVIPIHDWHWNDAAKAAMYQRFEQFFSDHGITFIKAKDGEPMDVDL
jgi:L-ascorbate metabolism protein UlaG (beta-lactamase superfamily)